MIKVVGRLAHHFIDDKYFAEINLMFKHYDESQLALIILGPDWKRCRNNFIQFIGSGSKLDNAIKSLMQYGLTAKQICCANNGTDLSELFEFEIPVVE